MQSDSNPRQPAVPKVLCIKLNNAATNDPCAICGRRTDPLVGPEVFVEGTWDLVCNLCSQRLAPDLLAIASHQSDMISQGA